MGESAPSAAKSVLTRASDRLLAADAMGRGDLTDFYRLPTVPMRLLTIVGADRTLGAGTPSQGPGMSSMRAVAPRLDPIAVQRLTDIRSRGRPIWSRSSCGLMDSCTCALAVVGGLGQIASLSNLGLATHLGWFDLLSPLAERGEAIRADQSVNGA